MHGKSGYDIILKRGYSNTQHCLFFPSYAHFDGMYIHQRKRRRNRKKTIIKLTLSAGRKLLLGLRGGSKNLLFPSGNDLGVTQKHPLALANTAD